jgi:hypothetical protein
VRVTPQGGTVHMRAEKASGRPRFVTVCVSDTGPGIAREEVCRIFEPFVHAGLPTLDGLGGTGLGLPISHQFAMGMGGELDVTSNDQGSTFHLRLPRDRIARRARSGPGAGDVGPKANSVPLQAARGSHRGTGSSSSVVGSSMARALDKRLGPAHDQRA